MISSRLVSVCIPVRNADAYIGQTLESVLLQKYPDLEVIVQDNCSTDSTWDVVTKFASLDARIKAEKNPRDLGMSANWNAAILRACGAYKMILSADDLLEPDFVDCCIQRLEATGARVVSGHFWYVDGQGAWMERAVPDIPQRVAGNEMLDLVLSRNPFQINLTLFRADLLKEAELDGMVFRARWSCDYDLFLRLGVMKEPLEFITERIGFYRTHPSSLSGNVRRLHAETLKTLFDNAACIAPRTPARYLRTVGIVCRRLVAEWLKSYVVIRRMIGGQRSAKPTRLLP